MFVFNNSLTNKLEESKLVLYKHYNAFDSAPILSYT